MHPLHIGVFRTSRILLMLSHCILRSAVLPPKISSGSQCFRSHSTGARQIGHLSSLHLQTMRNHYCFGSCALETRPGISPRHAPQRKRKKESDLRELDIYSRRHDRSVPRQHNAHMQHVATRQIDGRKGLSSSPGRSSTRWRYVNFHL